MPRNNSRERRDQRREKAADNAKAQQVICEPCGLKRHRAGRCQSADPAATQFLTDIFTVELVDDREGEPA